MLNLIKIGGTSYRREIRGERVEILRRIAFDSGYEAGAEDAGSGELLVEGLELRYALFKEGAVQNPGESAITCIPPWMAALLYHKPWP